MTPWEFHLSGLNYFLVSTYILFRLQVWHDNTWTVNSGRSGDAYMHQWTRWVFCCWCDWIPMIKIQWNIYQYPIIFIHENTFENVDANCQPFCSYLNVLMGPWEGALEIWIFVLALSIASRLARHHGYRKLTIFGGCFYQPLLKYHQSRYLSSYVIYTILDTPYSSIYTNRMKQNFSSDNVSIRTF